MSNFVHKSSSPDTSQSSNLSSLFNKKNKISDDLGKAEGSSIKLENKVANKKFIKIPFLKLRLPIQAVLGFVVLLLLVVGGASAMFLTQMNQDVRQQASGAYCGDGICQNKGNPCQCLQDCSGEPGADQCGQSGTSSSNTSGSTSQSSSSVASTGGSSSACKSGEIFCGGCINGCRPANVKCNTQIDNECKQTGCGGNGVFPAAGEQCCSGLQQCANGRCAPSCSLDSNPICGGIREGSNCNNGGSWTCNSAGDKGTCVGGVWNQPVAPVGGTKTIEEVKEPVVQDTNFSTSSTAVYNIRCGLGGEILYVSNEKTCTDYKGVLVTPTLSVSPISYNECKEAHLSALNNKLGICKFVSATVGFEYQVNEVAPVSYRECIDAHASGVRNLLGTCEWVSTAVGYIYEPNEVAPVSFKECTDLHAPALRNLLGTCEWVSAAVGYEYQANEIAPVSYGECVDAHASGVRNLLGSCEWVSVSAGYEYQANEIAPVSYRECTDPHQDEIRSGLGTCEWVSPAVGYEYQAILLVSTNDFVIVDCFTSTSGCTTRAYEVEAGGNCRTLGYTRIEPSYCEDIRTVDCYTPTSGCTTRPYEVEAGGNCRTLGYTRIEPEECSAPESGVVEGPMTLEEATEAGETDTCNWWEKRINFSTFEFSCPESEPEVPQTSSCHYYDSVGVACTNTDVEGSCSDHTSQYGDTYSNGSCPTYCYVRTNDSCRAGTFRPALGRSCRSYGDIYSTTPC